MVAFVTDIREREHFKTGARKSRGVIPLKAGAIMEHDSQPEAYHVHVWIRGIHPMLWRRFLVRSDSTLADLHVALQIAFDWTDFHLHRFRIRKKDYAVPRLGGLACHDARKIKLADLHFRINERFLYEYRFSAISGSTRCGLRNGWK